MPEPGVRLSDILTTASAVANYLGESTVRPEHVVQAIALVRGELTMDDLGRPVSPLVPRPPTAGVDAAVRRFAQEWFGRLGEDVMATLTVEQFAEFEAAARALASRD